jgi:hypothetical protein
MRSKYRMSREIASGLAIGLLLIPTVACAQSKPGKVGNPSVLTNVADISMPARTCGPV